ncbi:hypothetical protein MTP03_17340 [Tsukamurella sp. PLM1]|nr:hypothetical protein MTP03_17340 [Tsukamurella sp. PLM1]
MFLGAVIACAASLAWAASSGPDPFPTHWNASGEGDAFSPRGTALAINAAVAGGVAVLFGLLAKCAPAIPDSLINLPPGARAYWLTPEHRGEFDAILERSMLLIGTGVMLLLSITVVGTIVSSGPNTVLAVSTWVFLALVLASVAHMVWVLVRTPKRAS